MYSAIARELLPFLGLSFASLIVRSLAGKERGQVKTCCRSTDFALSPYLMSFQVSSSSSISTNSAALPRTFSRKNSQPKKPTSPRKPRSPKKSNQASPASAQPRLTILEPPGPSWQISAHGGKFNTIAASISVFGPKSNKGLGGRQAAGSPRSFGSPPTLTAVTKDPAASKFVDLTEREEEK